MSHLESSSEGIMCQLHQCLVWLALFCNFGFCIGKVFLRPSIGVAFVEQTRTLRPWAGEKKLTFVIRLPKLKKLEKIRMPKLTCAPSTMSIYDNMCLEGHKEVGVLVDITNELVDNANKELQYLKKALKTLKLADNSKRALINAGSFFESVFGTASSDSVSELYEQLKQVHKNVEEAATDRQSLYDAMHNMQESDFKKFNSAFHMINRTNDYLTMTVRNLTATNSKLDTIYGMMNNPNSYTQLHVLHMQHTAILSRHGYLRDLLRTYREFHKDIYVLLAGKLPSSMIPASELLSGLTKLKRAAVKKA